MNGFILSINILTYFYQFVFNWLIYLTFQRLIYLCEPFLRHKKEKKKKNLCEQNVLNELCIFTRLTSKSYSYGGSD